MAKANATDFKTAAMGLVVDRLGDVRAQAKRLKDEIKDLEATLIARGLSVIDGHKFVATIVDSERKITDWKKISIDLGATKQKIAKNTRRFGVTAVRVSAHKK